jgi:hypothetical protein
MTLNVSGPDQYGGRGLTTRLVTRWVLEAAGEAS